MNKLNKLDGKQLLEIINKNKTDLDNFNKNKNSDDTQKKRYDYIMNNIEIEINKINKSEIFLKKLYEFITQMFKYDGDSIKYYEDEKLYISKTTLISKLDKNSNVLLVNIPLYLLNKDLLLNNRIDLFYDIESMPIITNIYASISKIINIINIIGYYFLTNANIYLTNNLSYLLHKNLDLDEDLIIPNNKFYNYLLINAEEKFRYNLNNVLYSGDDDTEKIVNLCNYFLENNGLANIMLRIYHNKLSKAIIYDEPNDEYKIDFSYIQELNQKMNKYKIKIVSANINKFYAKLLILNNNY